MGLPMGLPSLTLPFILLGFEKIAFKTCRAGLFKHNEFFFIFFFCFENKCSSEDCYYKLAIKYF